MLPWQLPVLLEVRVAVGVDAPAEELPPLDPPSDPVVTPVDHLPVPVAQEEC